MSKSTYVIIFVVALLAVIGKASAHHNGACHYISIDAGIQIYACP